MKLTTDEVLNLYPPTKQGRADAIADHLPLLSTFDCLEVLFADCLPTAACECGHAKHNFFDGHAEWCPV